MLPQNHERKCGATPQGVAKRIVEGLLREGKHKASEPPPEALPQKDKRNPEALSCKHKLKHPEVPPQRGRREPEVLLPDSECEHGTMPQGTPNKGICEPGWPSRDPSHEVTLSTWEGPGPWDPGRGLTEKHIVDSEGLLRPWTSPRASTPTAKTTMGIVTHKKIPDCAEVESVCQYRSKEPATYLYPYSITLSSRRRGVHPFLF